MIVVLCLFRQGESDKCVNQKGDEMGVNFNGAVNNRHYLVFGKFSIFFKSEIEMHNSFVTFT